ncbi:MAG: hypothetical protein HFG70_00585 [Hungatella sp.]|nr:hypothetical protein [Hungatella sp.]
MERLKKYPVLSSLAFTMVITIVLCLRTKQNMLETLAIGAVIGLICFYPFVLTVLNFGLCFVRSRSETGRRAALHLEAATMILGVLLSLLLAGFVDIDFTADWPKVLSGNMAHTPIWTQAYPTAAAFLGAGIGGYGVLRGVSLKKMPPLVIVLSISAMYLGMAESLLWVIQIFTIDGLEFYLCLLPLNWVFICVRLMREKAVDWRDMEEEEKRTFRNPFLEKLNKKVMDSGKWPLWSFFLCWPLAGLGIMILALFGQRPDNVIRAWTETSQWNLSSRISPPNLMVDDHYLCTVAAGGHRRLVKPLRMGVRRGHRIVVNRQLCIANGFEQILEEKAPRLHRRVRGFYDTYGFPIADRIRSPYAADLVYIVMKPLEWFFLAVIYLTDARPEDRIYSQYLSPMPKGYNSLCESGTCHKSPLGLQ